VALAFAVALWAGEEPLARDPHPAPGTESSTRIAKAKAEDSETSDPRYPFAERIEGLAGLENVGRITPRLYRGGAPTREGLETLKGMGIKTVVNLRHYHGQEERVCREVGIGYLRIALESSDAPTDEAVRRFLRTVTDPRLEPVYFHCWRGKDRTGTMAAVYRMTVEGWPLEAALAERDAFGFYHGWRDLDTFTRGFAKRLSEFWPEKPQPDEVTGR
jgi:hypothetical protein